MPDRREFLGLLSAVPFPEKATAAPARVYSFPAGCGTLRPGAPADVAVLRLEEGSFTFTDSYRQTRMGTERLVPVTTIRAGRRVQI